MLHFSTPSGKRYTVDEQGRINGYSGWKFLGIAAAGPGYAFGQLVLSFEQLTPEVVQATQWRYRTSRNPRFTVIDLDHGSRRVWGNTQRHGVSSMWYD